MAELDVKAERAKIEAELQLLDTQLKEVEAKRQVIINAMVMKEGALAFLERLDGEKPHNRR